MGRVGFIFLLSVLESAFRHKGEMTVELSLFPFTQGSQVYVVCSPMSEMSNVVCGRRATLVPFTPS